MTVEPTTSCCEGVLSRRTLLRGGLVAGAALATGALPGVSVSVASAAGPSGGDVLVVLSLRGGFDGLSALAPVFDPGYAAARPTLAVPAAVALPADRGFGLHPQLAPLKPLWDAGRVGAVVAVGQPTGSRSHFSAMEELERAAPGSSVRTGWLDRVLGAKGAGRPLQAVSLGSASPGLRGPNPDVTMRSLDGFSLIGDPRLSARRLAASRRMQPDPAGPVAVTAAALGEASRARAGTQAGPGYPDSPLGRALADVARLVKADTGVQVVTVDQGDWDHHEGLGTVDGGRMRTQLGDLAASLAAFDADLGPVMSRVTLVTLSEFGRRVAENGSAGTDHGNANTVLLLGGGVVGGRVHGPWPGLARPQLDDGDLAVRTDYRDVLAEVLQKRCGLSDVSSVFPGFRPAPLGVVRQA